jgi:hypothetical protein
VAAKAVIEKIGGYMGFINDRGPHGYGGQNGGLAAKITKISFILPSPNYPLRATLLYGFCSSVKQDIFKGICRPTRA